MFIIFIQALYLIFLVNKRNLFNEKNYIVGLVFIFLVHTSVDLLKLSPVLMANLFLLFGLNAVLRQIEKRDGVGDDVFEAGLFVGIATLFYLPVSVFIVWVLFGLIFFTGVNIRQVFMVLLAFILPLFFMYLFFYFSNNSDSYLNLWLFNINYKFRLNFLSIKDILIVYLLPSIIGFLGIIKVLSGNRYNSFQNRSHQLFIVFVIFAFLSFFVSGRFEPFSLFFLLVPMAFFVSGFFIHLKKILFAEGLFLLLLVLSFTIFVIGFKPLFGFDLNTLSNLKLENYTIDKRYEGKKMFVTGSNIDAYKNNPMATGYISWDLAKNDFENPNNYLSLANIYNNFKKDMPEVIIDSENVIPKIFKNLPELNSKFTLVQKGVYVQKK
jgi:hypothetical protein